ncbi:MAG: alpha-mannosidase [Firmicutes bacterium]|nr:alpha-mannosidase [Bacillota bacterium]
MENLHLIGNAHLDPVWLWRWPEGAAEIKATFLSALERMEETPGYIFTAGAVRYYEWVYENEPALFARIEEKVREGRWVPVGGWWVQPDCNVPSGESFARHTLLGQAFLKQFLNHPAKIGYNVDSFGHNAGIPQLLLESGMKYYVMMRPGEHEKHLPTVFWWEGPDGSRVLTHRIMAEYSSAADGKNLEKKIDQIRSESERISLPLMVFYGVGNHGGGPTHATLEKLTSLMKEDTTLLFSDPERYFEELEKYGDRIPVIKGDLQHHASGCYSTDGPGKQAHKHAEAELVDAEKMMSVAHEKLELPYEADVLRQSWKTLLFNEFHDIMGGCSLREALEDMHQELGGVRGAARDCLNKALQKIAFHVDTENGKPYSLTKEFDWTNWETAAGGAPVIVFNTLSWPVKAPVQVYNVASRVEDEDGRIVPVQNVRASRTTSQKMDSIFMAEMPAMGYRLYRISRHQSEVMLPENDLSFGEDHIENAFFRIRFEGGEICEILDKRIGRNILRSPIGLKVIDCSAADTWAHGIFTFHDLRGCFSGISAKVTETGPVRLAMCLESSYGASKLRLTVSLLPQKAQIHLSARLLWVEEQAMAKFSVPLVTDPQTASFEQAYSVVEKTPSGREQPAQMWGDVTGVLEDGSVYGAALANDSRYSYETDGNELRLTLARSAAYADHAGPKVRDEFSECMDLGEHRVKMVLVPHVGSAMSSGIDRAAQELMHPLMPIFETYHPGKLPKKDSFASVSGPVRITALKQAEDGKGIIIRLWNPLPKTVPFETNIHYLDVSFQGELDGYRFAGYRITADRQVIPVDLMEEKKDEKI